MEAEQSPESIQSRWCIHDKDEANLSPVPSDKRLQHLICLTEVKIDSNLRKIKDRNRCTQIRCGTDSILNIDLFTKRCWNTRSSQVVLKID